VPGVGGGMGCVGSGGGVDQGELCGGAHRVEQGPRAAPLLCFGRRPLARRPHVVITPWAASLLCFRHRRRRHSLPLRFPWRPSFRRGACHSHPLSRVHRPRLEVPPLARALRSPPPCPRPVSSIVPPPPSLPESPSRPLWVGVHAVRVSPVPKTRKKESLQKGAERQGALF
jgi:hypothetical protein